MGDESIVLAEMLLYWVQLRILTSGVNQFFFTAEQLLLRS